SARRLYDVEGAIGPELRTLSVECDKEMQPLARIGVGDREEGRISDVEISLVERHLCEIVRIFLSEPVTLDLLPTPGVESLVLPHQGVNQISAQQIRAVNNDAVRVPAQRAIEGGESERLPRGEFEAGRDEVPAHAFLEIVSATEP